MRGRLPYLVIVLACLTVLVRSQAADRSSAFVAFSMNAAERLDRLGSGGTPLQSLGGITRVVGSVRDRVTGDLVVVGVVDSSRSPLSLDDLVVALRALHLHREAPLVSIDRTVDTQRTGRQAVRLEGGIADTAFGRDLIAADAVLKIKPPPVSHPK